jgi:hypothetical protein
MASNNTGPLNIRRNDGHFGCNGGGGSGWKKKQTEQQQ